MAVVVFGAVLLNKRNVGLQFSKALELGEKVSNILKMFENLQGICQHSGLGPRNACCRCLVVNVLKLGRGLGCDVIVLRLV
jgi:hypothetical protein